MKSEEKPNKATEPTSTSATARAISGDSARKQQTENRDAARGAPAPVVAHLWVRIYLTHHVFPSVWAHDAPLRFPDHAARGDEVFRGPGEGARVYGVAALAG